MRKNTFQMHICKSLIDLEFFAEVKIKLRKMYFFNNLRAITQEQNKEAEQMTTYCLSTFSTLFVTFISEFESTQNLFSLGIWYVEYLNI